MSLEAQRVNNNVKKQRKQQRGRRGEERGGEGRGGEGREGEGRGGEGGFVVLSFLTLCCFVCILLLISSSPFLFCRE